MTANIQLPYAKYRFEFIAEEAINLPPYSGSTWRGLFGHELKRTVCVTQETQCKNCLLWRNCVYTYLFETPPAVDAVMIRKVAAAPHPFIIQPALDQARVVKKGEVIALDISLIAKANQHLPYFIHTFQQAGKKGIGAQRSKFRLADIHQYLKDGDTQLVFSEGEMRETAVISSPAIPTLPHETISINFLTPFRARHNNQYVNKDRFTFYHFFSTILRRISNLSYFHADTELALDFAALIEQSKQVNITHKNLHWQDWSRYSSRQKSSLKMGGLLGSIELAPESIEPFWELLYLGSCFNAGKGTVMGLGHYNISIKTVL